MSNPKKLHALAVKQIGRFLLGTQTQGTVLLLVIGHPTLLNKLFMIQTQLGHTQDTSSLLLAYPSFGPASSKSRSA